MLLAGTALSALVEAAQYLLPLGRAVDVDDVVLNAVGTVAGAVTVSVVRRAVPPAQQTPVRRG